MPTSGYGLTLNRSCTCFRTPTTVLGCAGFHGDALTLVRRLQVRMTAYRHAHGREMRFGDTTSCVQPSRAHVRRRHLARHSLMFLVDSSLAAPRPSHRCCRRRYTNAASFLTMCTTFSGVSTTKVCVWCAWKLVHLRTRAVQTIAFRNAQRITPFFEPRQGMRVQL